MRDLTAATVFITGGAQGIGLGIAHAFAGAGARIALADLDGDRLEAAAAELSAVAEVSAYVLDVRDRDAFRRAVDAAEAELGPITVLCNNAGIGSTIPLSGLGADVWERVLAVNLSGVVNGLDAVLPRMLSRGGQGHIVNVASGAGLVPSTNLSYVTSKFAVVGLSESLRLQPELAAAGIGVCVVCPGLVRTDVLRSGRRQVTGDDALDDEGHALLQRHGLDPRTVGEQVLDAVETGRFYVLTDRYIEPLLRARHRELIDALPEETPRDRELATLLAARTADRPGSASGDADPGPAAARPTSRPRQERSA